CSPWWLGGLPGPVLRLDAEWRNAHIHIDHPGSAAVLCPAPEESSSTVYPPGLRASSGAGHKTAALPGW
ncbi:MAG: hypothetical protein ACKVVP_11720, partial [Chloroflexota bacterium]